MSEARDMTALEMATLDELVAELNRRSQAMLVALALEEQSEFSSVYVGGKRLMMHGLLADARHTVEKMDVMMRAKT